MKTGKEASASSTLNQLEINWPLALRRLKNDLDDDFWPDPIGFEDLIRGSDAFERLKAIIDDFQPSAGASYDVPKANCAVRSSIYLNFPDRLVYQGLVDVLIAEIDSRLSSCVFSHRLKGVNSPSTFHQGVGQFKQFDAAVAAELRKGRNRFLVVTDISHYFEGIRFRDVHDALTGLIRGNKPHLQKLPVLYASF